MIFFLSVTWVKLLCQLNLDRAMKRVNGVVCAALSVLFAYLTDMAQGSGEVKIWGSKQLLVLF